MPTWRSPPPRKKPKSRKFSENAHRFSWESITAIAAVVVAAISLYFSVKEAERNEQNRRISITPYIAMELEYDQNHFVKIYYRNDGLGPAKHKWLKAFFVDPEKPSSTKYVEFNNWPEFFELQDLKYEKDFGRGFPYPEEFLPAGGIQHIYFSYKTENGKLLWKRKNFFFVICYCSLYGDCRLESYVSDIPKMSKLLGDKLPVCDDSRVHPIYFHNDT